MTIYLFTDLHVILNLNAGILKHTRTNDIKLTVAFFRVVSIVTMTLKLQKDKNAS